MRDAVSSVEELDVDGAVAGEREEEQCGQRYWGGLRTQRTRPQDRQIGV
jgi:hypothetical protein